MYEKPTGRSQRHERSNRVIYNREEPIEEEEQLNSSVDNIQEIVNAAGSLDELISFLRNIDEITYSDKTINGEKVTKKITSDFFEQATADPKNRELLGKLPTLMGIRAKALELFDERENNKNFFYLQKAVEDANTWEEFIDVLYNIDQVEFEGEDENGEYHDVYTGKEFLLELGTADPADIEDAIKNIINIKKDMGGTTYEINLRDKAEELYSVHGVPEKDLLDDVIDRRFHREKFDNPPEEKSSGVKYKGGYNAHVLMGQFPRDGVDDPGNPYGLELNSLMEKAIASGRDEVVFSELSLGAQRLLRERAGKDESGTIYEDDSVVVADDDPLWIMKIRNKTHASNFGKQREEFSLSEEERERMSVKKEDARTSDPEGIHGRSNKDLYIFQLLNLNKDDPDDLMEELKDLISEASKENRKEILFSDLNGTTQADLNSAMTILLKGKEVSYNTVILYSSSKYWKQVLEHQPGNEKNKKEDRGFEIRPIKRK